MLYTNMFRFAADGRTTRAAAGHMAINATWPSCGASAEYPARKNPTIREKNECPFILILPWQVVFAVVSRSFRLAQQLSPSRAGRGSLVGKSRTIGDFRLLRIVITSNSPKPFQTRMHSRRLHSLSIVPGASRWRISAVNAVSLATAIRANSDLDLSGTATRDAHTRRITSPSTNCERNAPWPIRHCDVSARSSQS